MVFLRSEADRNRPFCFDSNLVRNRWCSYDQRQTGTDPFALIQILLGTDLVPPTMAEADKKRPFCYNSDQMYRQKKILFYDGGVSQD